ncbi:MAG: L-erythro-3,5-diaminohexanoate dehydrogenase [Myxococcales bacterium]|nr:L-erythro-3,5-diaminohexanoate dehydrogenase [Myxococcota bacterium]MDW8281343.1 L-erythro-3,5-diaminohexanoate dehydrogenase [Myxococcales bacterium]
MHPQPPLLYRYGAHRVLEPPGPPAVLPQAAVRLRNEPELPDDEGGAFELVLDVEWLNVDSASFRQLEEEARAAGEPPEAGVAARVQAIVSARGKLHNPVTGSGGMLLGRVRRVGAGLPPPHAELRPGERVATLVSLTLTPLRLESVRAVHLATHQLEVVGTAVLFASGAWARLPDDLPAGVVLAALDVAGAAPQVARLVRSGDRVLVLGCGGKSGLLAAAAARRVGAGLVVGLEVDEGAARDAEALGYCQPVLRGDVQDALGVASTATAVAGGEFDLVVSCVNAAGAEMAAILCAREGGRIYFFSMATSFTRAALGAEGVSRDVEMLIGNGYCAGHAEATLALLRQEQALRELFVRRYGRALATPST